MCARSSCSNFSKTLANAAFSCEHNADGHRRLTQMNGAVKWRLRRKAQEGDRAYRYRGYLGGLDQVHRFSSSLLCAHGVIRPLPLSLLLRLLEDRARQFGLSHGVGLRVCLLSPASGGRRRSLRVRHLGECGGRAWEIETTAARGPCREVGSGSGGGSRSGTRVSTAAATTARGGGGGGGGGGLRERGARG